MATSSSAINRVAKALQGLRPDFTLTNARTFATHIADAPAGVFGAKPLAYLPGDVGPTRSTHTQPAPQAVIGAESVETTRLASPPRTRVCAGGFVTPVGRTRNGEFGIDWAKQVGAILGGRAGGGRTVLLNTMLAGMAGVAEIHLASGNGGVEHDALAPVLSTYIAYERRSAQTAPGLPALVGALSHMARTGSRMGLIKELSGQTNFWSMDADVRKEARLYPIVVAIDEVQPWFEPNREDREHGVWDQILFDVTTLLQLGRALGIVVMLSTQKPDMGTLPTRIRNLCGIRIGVGAASRFQQKAVFAHPDLAYQAGPTEVDDGEPVHLEALELGDFVAEDVDAGGAVFGKSYYVNNHDIDRSVDRVIPAPDQFALACGYPLTEAMAMIHRGETLPPASA